MGWFTQSEDEDTEVRVSGDRCKDGRERTDILIIDKASDTHIHGSIGSEANSEFTQYGGERSHEQSSNASAPSAPADTNSPSADTVSDSQKS